MRDNMKPCNHNVFNDAIYKEVVVIGNGPSGLVTSFMLAGNVPYLKEVPEDLPIDDMLRARLSNVPPEQSLYEADLSQLAEGLEGRSHNPIPLLMDNLLRPCADMGIDAEPLLEWRYQPEKQIDHVVLGRGPPGGSWHSFPPHIVAVSPAAWLCLPPHRSPLQGGERGRGEGEGEGEDCTARTVANYCRKYVTRCRLQKFFRTGVVVTSVTRVPQELCDHIECHRSINFYVTGYDQSSLREFRYITSNVVIAAGGADKPNTLPLVASHAVHTLKQLDDGLNVLQRASIPRSVLVVGSGVSAADAVSAALRAPQSTMDPQSTPTPSPIAVHHVHRTPPPAALLPATEHYRQIYKMMCDGPNGQHENYTPYPDYEVTDVTVNKHDPALPDKLAPKTVTLKHPKTQTLKQINVSLIAVLIGSRPDLNFLQTNYTPTIEAKCKCNETLQDRQCFLKNHWHYIKSVLGQTVQICKNKYLSYSEINGNNESNCKIDDCRRLNKNRCNCNSLVSRLENGVVKTKIENDCNCFADKLKCYCKMDYASGLGYGLDPSKPVDGRTNPIAIDTSTHEVLNAPKGVYALGPVTADNFIRFLPGGALAIVAHIHKEKSK